MQSQFESEVKIHRVGVLGGTFNPVHNGHLHLAEEFHKRLKLDRVLLIPTNEPPHKDGGRLLPVAERLEMCRIAAQGAEYLHVCGIEARRGGRSYTVETLRALSEKYADSRLYFLMGADMFLTLEQWKNFEEITRLAALCTMARHPGELKELREHARMLGERYGAECHIEDFPVLEISSTQVRDLLLRGSDPDGLLPEGVAAYIQEAGLYGAESGD